MKIVVSNLGVIQGAALDLEKQLILFCGLNSTGKTYLSYIVYYVLSQNSPYYYGSFGERDSRLASFSEDGKMHIHLDGEMLLKYKSHIVETIKHNLDELFGMPFEDVQKMFSALDIKLETTLEECKERINKWSFNEKFDNQYGKFTAEKPAGTQEIIITFDSERRASDAILVRYLVPLFYRRLTSWPVLSSQIFPVERNSIYTFNKELSISRNALIDQMQKLSKNGRIDPFMILENGSKRYPKAISDGIMMANDLSNLKKTPGPFYSLACDLEQELLHGSLSIGQEGEVEFLIGDKKRRRHIPIHMSASLIKTMASFFFYLKYKAQRNDLAIIDEPEMNMHPDMQLLFVRIIVKLMDEGMRFLISTHSDYIVRELNYYMMKEEVEGEGIDRQQVAAYYFVRSNNKRVVVSELEVDRFGIQIPSIDEVVDSQNERCASMIEQLLQKDEQLSK